MDGSNQEIEFLKMENQQLKADKEAEVVAAQINLQGRMAEKQLDANIKQEEFRLKWAELGMKQEGEKIKLGLEAQKIADDYEKEVARVKLEGVKMVVADTIHSVV